MEQNENKTVETAEATQVSHEETRKKLKKQRVRQIVASLIGVAILAFGLWKIVCLFLDYNSNETSNDAQIEQYISPVNPCIRLYRQGILQRTSGSTQGRYPPCAR